MVYSNSYSFRSNDWVELLLVTNNVEFPLVLKNVIQSDKEICKKYLYILVIYIQLDKPKILAYWR